jgi:hypothetical protein
MKNTIFEIEYQLITFIRWLREQRLRLMGVNRKFYCQREEEWESKCINQCEHCGEYYKPLEEYHKKINSKDI